MKKARKFKFWQYGTFNVKWCRNNKGHKRKCSSTTGKKQLNNNQNKSLFCQVISFVTAVSGCQVKQFISSLIRTDSQKYQVYTFLLTIFDYLFFRQFKGSPSVLLFQYADHINKYFLMLSCLYLRKALKNRPTVTIIISYLQCSCLCIRHTVVPPPGCDSGATQLSWLHWVTSSSCLMHIATCSARAYCKSTVLKKKNHFKWSSQKF